MDSGLIFPIIVALWLAYLVPHWIRRREQLSASRSVDRFSAAMRVLARRDDPAVAERRPVSRSYVLMPPRQDVVDLVVKRARPVDTAPTRELAPPLIHPRDLAEPSPRPRRDLAEASRPPRALGVLLLGALTATPVTAVLAAFGTVAPVVPAGSLLMAVVTVALLRRVAIRRRAAVRRVAVPAQRTGQRMPAPRRLAPSESAVPASVAATDVAGAAEPTAEEDPDAWTPVPVPPPTYTLKPAAPVRRVLPWEAEPSTSAPAPATRPRTVPAEPAAAVRRVVPDLDLVLERRRAAGE